MSDGGYVILGGLVICALCFFFVANREDRMAEKEQGAKKGKVQMIESALKILAREDDRVREALKQAGIL